MITPDTLQRAALFWLALEIAAGKSTLVQVSAHIEFAAERLSRLPPKPIELLD